MTSAPRLIAHIAAKKTQNENGAAKIRQNEGLEVVGEAQIVCQRGLVAKMAEIEPGGIDLGKLSVSQWMKDDKNRVSQTLIG